MSQSQAVSSLEYRVGDQPVPGYTLVRELGRGAMGVVWLAETESGFERALKVINLQQRGGKKEYRGLRTIKQRKLLHGNLLTLIDYWLRDRDGKFIPDSDELDDSDSFFASVKAAESKPSTLAATTPQSMGTTDAEAIAATRQADLARSTPPGAVHAAATMVSAGAPANLEGLGSTLDFSAPQKPPGRRPVQLIVAMELGHKTLDDRQKQCHEDRLPGVPIDELLPYMEQAARGLDYLHREGIVHRDVKPQNIMLVGDVAKVCDYGLVVTTDANLRATSNAFTPLYASPEAVADQAITGQSDQYSLAVTYIELRTGHTPYASETAASVYAAKETGKYDLSRIRNSAVRSVLKRALAKSPHERFGSCSQFIRDLEKAEHSGSGFGRMLMKATALLVVGAGVALAVPSVRERFFPKETPNKGEVIAETPAAKTETPVAKPERPEVPKVRKVTEEPVVAVPAPTPELRQVVADARQLRLADKFDEAAAKLDELKIDAGSTDLAHWPFHVERLHLDVSRHLSSPGDVALGQWEAWQQRAEQLSHRTRGQGAEQVQLATLQVFVATRLNEAELSLAQPLADDFARISAGKDQWSKVLSQAEQARLHSFYEALGQRMVGSREPLPPAWKQRLAEIWIPPTAAQKLIERVRERIREASAEGLAIAAADLEEVVIQSELESAPGVKSQLAEVRLAIKQAQNRLLVESLARHLTKDDFLVDSVARKTLVDQIQALGDTSELPLAALLRIEAELAEHDASDKRYAAETLDELRDLVSRFSGASETTREWLDYARFLLARVEINSQRGAARSTQSTSQLDVLLAWPESVTTDWHTSRRKEQAMDALLRLADASLPVSDKDAIRFQDLPREWLAQSVSAVKYLEKARRLGCEAPDLHGLMALSLSIAARQSEQPDAWSKVAQSADQALASWGNVGDLSRQSRFPAVQYVSALAASRLQDATAIQRNRQAIATFAGLLKQVFKDEAPRNANVDRGILENIVLPGLKVRLEGIETPGAELAALWGAKGRLIERNPSRALLSIPGVNPAEHADDYARAMLTAHDAYAQALALHDEAIYAGGMARTVLKLPRELFDWKKYEGELARLVERRSQAELKEPSLLFADACVLRRRALLAPQRTEQLKLAQEAIDRFSTVDAATRLDDPYGIRGVALCAASDTYLKAAFWTPIQASDESKASAAGQTKYALLNKALDSASAAQSDANLLLPEEARTAKGNALEDLGYYYKETDYYQQAISAFQDALDQVGRQRSKAYALMSLGRCHYRWARDAARIDGNPEERVRRLKDAYRSLSDAVAHANAGDASVAPEATFWLATVIVESAVSGPGSLEAASEISRGFRSSSLAGLKRALGDPSRKADASKELAERFQQMEQARQQMMKAAQDARSRSLGEWANYLPSAASLGKMLYVELRQVENAVSFPVAATVILEQARGQIQELLAFAQQHPGSLSAEERRSLIDLLVGVEFLVEPVKQKAAALLQSYEKLFADDNDESRLQVVLLRLARARSLDAADCSDAEMVAGRIANPSLAIRARSACEKFKADSLLAPVANGLRTYLKDPQTSKALTLADDSKLLAVQNAYAAALNTLSKSSDAKTVENLNRLFATPLDEIESGKWGSNFTHLEAESLRRNIEDSIRIRIQLYELLDARISLHQWKLKDLKKALPEDGRLAVRQTLECLKPIRFLEIRFSDSLLDDYLRDLLKTCEARVNSGM